MSDLQSTDPDSEGSLLEQRGPLGVPYALVILFGFFFLMPSAFRAARLGIDRKENNVKDWLPSDFVETSELEWFSDHFAGEGFVVATWPGCNEADQRLKLLESKLKRECADWDPAGEIDDPRLAEDYRSAKEYGIRLGLLPGSRELDNWGGLSEKWLSTADGKWYYITPDGRLYRWEGKSNGPAGLVRTVKRALGVHELEGTYVAAFADGQKGDVANPFYNDPSLVCAPMFQSVETGVSVAKELAREGGPLWPVDLIDQSRRAAVAKRRAIERLTGSLFAPAVPQDFDWSARSFRSVIPDAELPEDFDYLIDEALTQFASERLDGDRSKLATAESNVQSDAWYAAFDEAGVEPPPRQTCLLITLTPTAKDNLSYALGRGVMGAPRGRLLELANDSGVQPASPPSLAPPPFDQPEIESIAGAPPLRLGGPVVDNVAIDEEGSITLVRLVGYSVLVGLVLSYLCFGSLKLTVMVFIVGGSAAMLSMAFVFWTGGHVDAVLMSMPSLVYVLGLSGSIHVVNYYRDELRRGNRSGAATRALRHAFFPCSLAALTTAIGLGSLYISNLTPISNFGIYSAIGVVATLGILFSYLPAALQTFPTELPTDKRAPEADDSESWFSDAWAMVGRWICGHHAFVSVVCLLAMVAIGIGIWKTETSVQLLKLFDSEARIIRDYGWLEDNFGKLVPMELVLRVPPEAMQENYEADSTAAFEGLSLLERVEAVSRISQVVNATLGEPGLDIVGTASGAHTFMKPLPAVSNSFSIARSLYANGLAEGRAELLENDYLALEQQGPYKGSELWRISLRVDALSDVDYGAFIKTLRTSVEPVMRAYDTRQQVFQNISAEFDSVGSGGASADDGRPKILVLGAARPELIADTELVSPPGDGMEPIDSASRIRGREIYLSTLEELLSGGAVARPSWLNHASETQPVDIGGETWKRLVEKLKINVIVWVGEGLAPTTKETGTRLVIDASAIEDNTIEHGLADVGVPESIGAGALQVVYTGVVPVVYKAQRTLLTSLGQSIAMAFVMIAFVMIVLLNPAGNPIRMLGVGNAVNGTASGLISMVPNLFPVVLVFGAMGHLGQLIDIGTMMTASVAMGVAVDDTIHFLSWFRSYLDKGYDRIKAIELTYRRVGPAMTQTTIIGGIGLFVFALSTFTPTQRFGSLMLVLLASALIGDLILLPGLLAGPLGRFFKPREGSPGALGSDPGEFVAVDSDNEESGDEGSSDTGIDKNSIPHLKLHSESMREDQPHRMKGR